MKGTKILWGQVLLVGAVVLAFVWAATEWTAWRLAFSQNSEALGSPYSAGRSMRPRHSSGGGSPTTRTLRKSSSKEPISRRRARSPLSLWPSRCRSGGREKRKASRPMARPAGPKRERSVAPASLKPTALFLAACRGTYLRHDGPEHVLCFAPTRCGKGVGLVVPTLLDLARLCYCPRY